MTAGVSVVGGVRRGTLTLDAELHVEAGRTLALLGPNGAGKTTMLRLVAGLTPLDRGRISIDGVVVDEPATATFAVAESRSVGYVFQEQLLFPHLDAVDNVAFGLRCRGRSRRDSRAAAARWLERVGLGEHAGARPRHLSGGQAQRVAVARALAPEPSVLLLDEPLAALDAVTRSTLRRLLADLEVTTVVVTHDPIEARALADRVAVLEAGRLTQEGSPDEVASHPATPWIAGLLGVNLVPGEAQGTDVSIDGGALHLAEPTDGPIWVAFEPNAVVVHPGRPAGSSRNVWRATVTEVTVEGDRARVLLSQPAGVAALVTRGSADELGLAPGVEVWAAVKATELAVRPR